MNLQISGLLRKSLAQARGMRLVEILFCLYIILLPIMNVPILPLFGQKLQYADLVFLPIAIIFFILFLKKKIRWINASLYIPILLYLAWNILSIFHAIDKTQGLLEISGATYLGILFVIIVNLVTEEKILRRVLISWIIALGVVVVCGLIGVTEAYLFKKGGSLFMCNYDTLYRYRLMHSAAPRVIATLKSPDMLMSFLVVSSGLLIGFYKSAEKRIKIFIVSSIILSLFITLFTASRGILALLVCIVIATSGYSTKPRALFILLRYLLAVTIAVLFVAFVVLSIWEPAKIEVSTQISGSEGAVSINFHHPVRFYLYKYALAMIKDHPFIGVGSGNFNSNLAQYYYNDKNRDSFFKERLDCNPHTTYLGLAAEMGLMGILFFLGIFLLFFKDMFKILKKNRDVYIRRLALGIIAAVSGILLYVLALDIQNLRHLWFVLALGISLKNLGKS